MVLRSSGDDIGASGPLVGNGVRHTIDVRDRCLEDVSLAGDSRYCDRAFRIRKVFSQRRLSNDRLQSEVINHIPILHNIILFGTPHVVVKLPFESGVSGRYRPDQNVADLYRCGQRAAAHVHRLVHTRVAFHDGNIMRIRGVNLENGVDVGHDDGTRLRRGSRCANLEHCISGDVASGARGYLFYLCALGNVRSRQCIIGGDVEIYITVAFRVREFLPFDRQSALERERGGVCHLNLSQIGVGEEVKGLFLLLQCGGRICVELALFYAHFSYRVLFFSVFELKV